jgi:hypothetical protein
MPWYEADLLDYPVTFQVGHRKRVWSVTVRPTDGRTLLSWWKDAEREFVAEDVTKEFSDKSVLLHAWGDTKMAEYVARLAVVGGLQIRREAP